MKKNVFRTMVMSAVMAALVFVLTYTAKIPTPTGYVHLGDAAVYLAAALLPTPYAVFAAGLGGALSDILGGYISYAIPTFIIKAMLTLPFSNKGERMVTRRNLWPTGVGVLITVGGYYLTKAVLVILASPAPIESALTVTPWIAAVATIPENIGQAVVSAAVFLLIGKGLDRLGFKKRFSLA